MTILVDRLRALLGSEHVVSEPAAMAPFVNDWRGRYRGQAMAVVRPANAAELSAVVAACSDAGVAMVPQGGNTSLCGGATPTGDEVLVSLTRLNRIRAVDAANATITVEAGCTLAQVQEAAAMAGLLFPLSLAAEGTATIGGNLSTNAGGVQVLRYGNARDLCLGLEVVLPDGRLWDGLRGLRKDNTGYDLKQWFIGAEGTLGFITAAVLKLYPLPRQQATAWVSVADPAAAVALLGHLRCDLADRLTAFELIDRSGLDLVLRHIADSRDPLPGNAAWQVLIEASDGGAGSGLATLLQDSLERAIGQGLVDDAALAGSIAQAQAMWRLRENLSEAQKREGVSIKHDISLPVSRLAAFINAAAGRLAAAFPGVRIVCFGHAGDGNLHYNLSLPDPQSNAVLIAESARANELVYELVAELGGSISAEHGLGQLKREQIRRYKAPVELDLMRLLKDALDPRGLMNPGKVL
jgi:FAD/FMN-containing dehydrogenase